MLNQDDLKLLVGFNEWADNWVFDAAQHLKPEQLAEKHRMGFGSVFETLVHIMDSQRTWLSRWQGVSPQSLVMASDYKSLEQIGADWDKVHQDLQSFVLWLDDARLHSDFSYQNTKGQMFTHSISWTLLHMFNHSTEHRSQVAAICTMAGRDVGPMDMIHYIRNIMPGKK
jgi:uncharacterized damage-inducible protein DinB